MNKTIDYSKPIYRQFGGSYDACIPPFQGYQITQERDPVLFAEIEEKIASGKVVAIPEPTPPAPTPEELAAQARALLLSQLDALDRIVPRSLEDLIEHLDYVPYSRVQEAITQKVDLRTQLRRLDDVASED